MRKLYEKLPFFFACILAIILASAVQVAAIGGPIVLSGDDADDGGHCQGSACGQLYGKALNFVVTNSNSPGSGIVAIGANSGSALFALNSWNATANGGPNVPIMHVNTATGIAAIVFADFAAIYIASNDNNTFGGLTASQLTALNLRQTGIVNFVNTLGGGLMALTEAGDTAQYGWMPLPLTTSNVSHTGPDIIPTADMNIIAPGLTPANLSRCCYHTIFTGPPGFSGLTVLAFHDHNGNESFDGTAIDQVLILGGIQVTIQGNIGLSPLAALLGTGDPHTVTAAPQDGSPLAPAVGVTVTFTITAGPNIGALGLCSNPGCVTDASGNVEFTYVGASAGVDSIVASFGDSNGNTQTSNTVQATWEVRNQPPVADAGPDQIVEVAGLTTAVTLDGSGSSDPDGDPLTYTWTGSFGTASGPAPTVNLPLGSHTITLVVDDGQASDSDTVIIIVQDTTPPKIDNACLTDKLWPPNHKMVLVATGSVSDLVDPNPTVSISVTSNQPINGLGDGNTDPDWTVDINGTYSVSLRAERAGNLGQRDYKITVTATDAAGNQSIAMCSASVPHDQRGKK